MKGEYLPNMSGESASPWMGVRSSRPDGIPAIGLLGEAGKIAYAFSLAHNGLTLSVTIARCVAALRQHQTTPVDMKPYSIDRFRSPARFGVRSMWRTIKSLQRHGERTVCSLLLMNSAMLCFRQPRCARH